MIFEQIDVDVSDVELFNKIGNYAEENGCMKLFFKTLRMKNLGFPSMFEKKFDDMEYGEMHYIHIHKNGELFISIYFDDADMGAVIGSPYYELYDMEDIERFLDNEQGEEELFNLVKKMISE